MDSEGVIGHKDQIYLMTYCVVDDAARQACNQLRASRLLELPQLDRHFMINSTYDLCGKASLDKLIGHALLSKKLPVHDHILIVSGRASYELLPTCLFAGGPIFCAVSAPSSLAVSLAAQFGLTLIGFLRDNRLNIYTGLERIRPANASRRLLKQTKQDTKAPEALKSSTS